MTAVRPATLGPITPFPHGVPPTAQIVDELRQARAQYRVSVERSSGNPEVLQPQLANIHHLEFELAYAGARDAYEAGHRQKGAGAAPQARAGAGHTGHGGGGTRRVS